RSGWPGPCIRAPTSWRSPAPATRSTWPRTSPPARCASRVRTWLFSGPERISRRGRAENAHHRRGRPDRGQLLGDGRRELLHVWGRRGVHGLRDDQGRGGRVPHGRPAALPVRPAPGVRPARLVGEDDLPGLGVLDLTEEREVLLIASGVPHLERAGDLG